MKLPVDWLREYADPSADARAIAARMATCGFAVESLDGEVIDFEVTANRPDCLSIRGLAREVATAFELTMTGQGQPRRSREAAEAGSTGSTVPVAIESDLCGRYSLAIADVTVGASPEWISRRLADCGVRPINNVVDVTNYVMLEMGQPLHAFDVAKLAGPEIHVRAARPGEPLTTLDGETRKLDPAMLVIADRDRAAAVAGVMGGRASEVSAGTRRIAIESAWFLPASVRVTSKRLGLKTEASARFERGADIGITVAAIERVLELLERIGAGRRVGEIVDAYPRPVAPREVALDRSHLGRLLGATIADADVERILASLGFAVRPAAGGWQVRVPSFRVDVAREADLIEEVGRHWGFDRIPPTFPALTAAPPVPSDRGAAGRDARRLLCGAGLEEAATFTFIERAAAAAFVAHEDELVTIANPLSEKFAVLRPSLLPGLVDAGIYNQRRQQSDVRLFELGQAFSPGGERAQLGWVLSGTRHDHWSDTARPADFFDGTGVAGLMADAFGLRLRAEAADAPWSVRGRSARLSLVAAGGASPVGFVGQVKPALVTARGGASDAFVAGWLWLDPLIAHRRPAVHAMTPLPRFPSIVRDLAIVVDERLPAETVRGTIRANAPATLEAVREFDRYQGKGIPAGHVSLALRLVFRDPDRTLTDAETQAAVDAIVAALAREHGARLR